MPLRSFKAFTNTAPVSPTILVDSLGTITQTLAFPCNLVNLDGYANGAGWFQIFDLAVTPTSTSTVPLKSLQVTGAGNLSSLLSSLGPITLNKGLYCALSSTEAVYTAVATNFDVWGEIEEFENQLDGTSVAGDLTTGIDSLTVWNNASGPKTLFRVDVVNGTGAVAYLMVFGVDVPTNGSIPILPQMKLANVSTPQSFQFGSQGGTSPFGQSASYAAQLGCTLVISTTPATLTLAADGVSSIRALYK